MSGKSTLNGFDPETKKANGLSNFNEKNESLPQIKHLLKLKRGRKSSKINRIDYKIHDKDSPDNIRRKVKTHFHNFIVAI